MTTAELLSRSRESHRKALESRRRLDLTAAHDFFTDALLMRQQADESDPAHTDASWLLDLNNAMGQPKRDRRQTAAQIATDQHDTLIAYFESQLAGLKVEDREFDVEVNGKTERQTIQIVRAATPPKAPPMLVRDIKAAIQVPIGKDGQPTMKVEDSLAYQQLRKEQGR